MRSPGSTAQSSWENSAAHSSVVEEAERAAPLAPEKHVRRHREILDEGQFLVDDRDPGALGIAGPREAGVAAVDLEHSGVGLIDAGEDLHERALPRAILPADGMDLTSPHLEGDVVEGHHPREPLRDPEHPHGERGGGHRGEGPSSGRWLTW